MAAMDLDVDGTMPPPVARGLLARGGPCELVGRTEASNILGVRGPNLTQLKDLPEPAVDYLLAGKLWLRSDIEQFAQGRVRARPLDPELAVGSESRAPGDDNSTLAVDAEDRIKIQGIGVIDDRPLPVSPQPALLGESSAAAAPNLNWFEIVGARLLGERPLAARRPRKSPEYGPPSTVAHIEFDFRRWDGTIGEWSEHFGKGRGQVQSIDGGEPLRSCQEVEVAKRLRLARDHAFWFSAYSPSRVPAIWRPWVRTLRDAPAWLSSLDTLIRQQISSREGGMPDVVAWNDDDSLASALFIECKGRGETFGYAQEDWVWAARRAGVGIAQVAVSVRPF